MDDPTQERLKGAVASVVYHNPENGYAVLRVETGKFRASETVTGRVIAVTVGQDVEAHGRWVMHPRFGKQFEAKELRAIPPRQSKGLERYLASGMVAGIGKKFAKQLVKAFGEDLIDVIENEPERLLSVDGIGRKRQAELVKAWNEQRAVRDIMIFLQSHGIGATRAVKIYQKYGDEAVSKLQANPYCLIEDFHGIGFKTADQIAQALGLDPASKARAMAALKHVAQQLTQEGHCLLIQETLLARTLECLETPNAPIEEALEDMVASEAFRIDPRFPSHHVQLDAVYQAESGCASHLQRISLETPTWVLGSLEASVAWVQTSAGLTLSQGQIEALRTVFSTGLSVVTGGPGVGKTTLIKAVIALAHKANLQVLLTAPTGRAAKRMQESTGMIAKTIHRLLEFDPQTWGFKRNEHQPLPAQLLIVDESSMIDVFLMHDLLRAVPEGCQVVLVGDIDQLPSVGPGSILSDVIASGIAGVAKLTEIFRQAAHSQIILNAHRINQGQLPEKAQNPNEADFFWMAPDTPELIFDACISLVCNRLPNHLGINPIEDIQVLTPMQRNSLGAQNLNQALQGQLNPQPDQSCVERMGQRLGPGDKVMQLVNDYDKDVFNGDVGVVHRIDRGQDQLVVRYDRRLISYPFSDLDQLVLAYAVTIHKSQGSEYPVVVLPLAMQHYTMLERNLLYTGITRGKRMVVLVGQELAVRKAVKQTQAHQRQTFLRQRLKSTIQPLNV